MEAKDTIMATKEILEYLRKLDVPTPTQEGYAFLIMLEMLDVQAEISFEAGEQIGIAKGVMLKTRDLSLLTEAELAELNAQAKSFYDKAKQAGIKEVVEWLNENGVTQTDRWGNTIRGFWVAMPADNKFRNEWKAKLKEWRIEDGE